MRMPGDFIDKCGFTYEGTLREYFYRNGKYEDRMYFSILKKEFSYGTLGCI
jgi:ribosomal-protein-alanine N-acetyltransferase